MADERSDREGARGEVWASAIFRWRSYLPLAVVAALLAGLASGRAGSEATVRAAVACGLLLAAAGLAIRVYAVGHAPAGTSGRHRRQFAHRLNTTGVYSIVRHPLYVGNLLVWIGVSAASGWPLGAALSAVAGGAMFGAIVRHEDRFLRDRFEEWTEWAAATPALIPRASLWRPSRAPFRWPKAIRSEYSTLHTVLLLALLFELARAWAADRLPPGPLFWTAAVANSALYLAIRSWRRRSAGRTRPPSPPSG